MGSLHHEPAVQDAESAVRLIRPGSRIYVGGGCATPTTLIAALADMPRRPADIEFVSFLTTGATFGHTAADKHRMFFIGSDTRRLAETGEFDYVPIAIDEVPGLMANGRLPLDAAILQVSPPDARGYVSLGISVDLAPSAIRAAKLVIAEINPNMPRTHGDSHIHISQFHAFVEVDTPITEFVHPQVGDSTVQIARYIASLIEDGATLQIGVGRVPNEALRYLTDRSDLGVHSDCITDGLLGLVEAGVVTGRRKTDKPGRIVTSWAFGTRPLYDLVHENPMFSFEPIEQVCDTARISSSRRMVSITQAFAIDLTGQVCTDQLDGIFYGGVSAQAAFIRGAARSPEGKAIVCLSSMMDDGTTSRIKARFAAGDGVGISRADVHYVVTEFGAAYLFGKSIRERALALIEIAHPDVRSALLQEAKSLRLVKDSQNLASQSAYPVHEERRIKLHDGQEVLLRPARASDAPGLRRLFHALPVDDIYTRFFRRVRTLSDTELQSLCNVNHQTDVAFVAITGPRESEEIVASGCYFLNPTTNLAETAFMVSPPFQGRRLGSALQMRLREYAMSRGIRGFTAEILPRNARMLRLINGIGDVVTTDRDEDAIHVTMLFPAAAGFDQR